MKRTLQEFNKRAKIDEPKEEIIEELYWELLDILSDMEKEGNLKEAKKVIIEVNEDKKMKDQTKDNEINELEQLVNELTLQVESMEESVKEDDKEKQYKRPRESVFRERFKEEFKRLSINPVEIE